MFNNLKQKNLKYKIKYLNLKKTLNQIGGTSNNSREWCYGKNVSCVNKAIQGTNFCEECTKAGTSASASASIDANVGVHKKTIKCFGYANRCGNQSLPGKLFCVECYERHKLGLPTLSALLPLPPLSSLPPSSQNLLQDRLREMGKDIPSICDECNQPGPYGEKCKQENCGGYYFPLLNRN